MSKSFEEYLKKINFDRNFIRLKKNIKKQSIVIYGAGQLFQYINKFHDLKDLNIIGISDKIFNTSEEGKKFLGYKIIPKDKIKNYNPDILLISMQNYASVIENFYNEFKNTRTKIKILAKKSLKETIKDIWL